jgi:TRAP transporter TAXI family solute receptor
MKTFKILLLSSALSVFAAQAQNMSIATGGTGGVYYPMGGGLAAVLSKHIPGMSATAEVTGGSIDNLKLVGSGKPYIAFSMSDAAKEAQAGDGKFQGKPIKLRTLLVLYPNLMHVVTVESTNIKSFKDLKGKHISTGAPGSATEIMAFRELEDAGLDKDKDVSRERLSVAESVNAIKDRKIDAFFWVGGLPTAAVTDLANTPGMKIEMIENTEGIAAMNKKYGNLYFSTVIPKTMYSGMAKDNMVAAVSNILLVSESMSDADAYKIIKAIFDFKTELIQTHREFESVKLENQKSLATSIPFHPGALKYFKENGVKTE